MKYPSSSDSVMTAPIGVDYSRFQRRALSQIPGITTDQTADLSSLGGRQSTDCLLPTSPTSWLRKNVWGRVCAVAILDDVVFGRSDATTMPIDLSYQIGLAQRNVGPSISVSRDMIVPLGQSARGSMIVPSGAFLTWMELLEEEGLGY